MLFPNPDIESLTPNTSQPLMRLLYINVPTMG